MLSTLVAGENDIHIVALIHNFDELRNLFGRMLEIVVHCDNEISLDIMETAQKGGMLAEISCHLEYFDPVVLCAESLHDFPGAVLGTVIHQEQFKGFFYFFIEYFCQPCVQLIQHVFAVVYGNND